MAERARRFDLALATGLVVLTQVELWSQQTVVGSSRAVLAVVFLVAEASLFWRRTSALTCAALIAAGLVTEAAISGGDLSTVGWAIAVLVALYSAGAYLSLPRGLIALGLLVAGLAARELRDLHSYATDPYQGAFWWLLVAAAFGGGVYVRSRRQASLLREAAERAEVEAAEIARMAVAEERARIARELHDVVAHDVSAVVLQAEAAEEMLPREPERTRESLRTIQRLSREALGEMRQVLDIIRGGDTRGTLTPQPTLADLPALIQLSQDSKVLAELRIEGAPRPLAPGLEVSAYRVVQEALTNVRKHATGARATVTVRYEPSCLELSIADDGGAGAAVPVAGGHGLIGVRERVTFFGGEFDAGHRDGRGFTVTARFPTPPATGP